MPIDLGGRHSLNIYRVTYRSGINGRVARAWVKVPYGSVFAMTEALARKASKGEVIWFRVDVAKPAEIAENRRRLSRWLGAFTESSAITKVDWSS